MYFDSRIYRRDSITTCHPETKVLPTDVIIDGQRVKWATDPNLYTLHSWDNIHSYSDCVSIMVTIGY